MRKQALDHFNAEGSEVCKVLCYEYKAVLPLRVERYVTNVVIVPGEGNGALCY